MNPSWKTTVCGLLGALFLGLSQITEFPPLAVKILTLLAGLMPAVGLLFARDNKVTSEQVLNAGHAGATTGKTLPLIALLLAPALLFVGCGLLRPVDPGNDPLVVRTEQFLTTAQGTFLFTLQVDNTDRGFWRKKAPAFHEFCEDLRTPTPYQITNTLPRYRVALLTLDDVKTDYKAARASSNALESALATLQSLSLKAGAWLTIVTNR